ncbi:SDR family NAD(P)-dependent oxidoreductase [Eubacterium pyruvativorans]|uniref:SDR family NAD(P)-dependent oxidoreductase n=1 Tax=Eubacterium pyruvativorans TaxID=155865 RepID=UPI00115FDDBE|nr:SDR family NAD(P)-dependent oxidoreductase [Eubacterium pyruvativorans]
MTGGKNYGCKNVDGKVAIISGASYGMGQTMAELFAEEGTKVVMTTRGKDKLDAAVKTIHMVFFPGGFVGTGDRSNGGGWISAIRSWRI